LAITQLLDPAPPTRFLGSFPAPDLTNSSKAIYTASQPGESIHKLQPDDYSFVMANSSALLHQIPKGCKVRPWF
jgi:hypothetical protein